MGVSRAEGRYATPSSPDNTAFWEWKGQFPASLDQIVSTSVSTSQGTPTTANHQQLVEARKDPP